MVGIVVLAAAAVSARSIALARFGLDLLIEIAASTVVLWELAGPGGLSMGGQAALCPREPRAVLMPVASS